MTLDEYTKRIARELPRHFAPGGIYYGKEGALRLAREFGYGLRDYPKEHVRGKLGSFYSTLLVKNTFGTRGGVPLDNAEFVAEMMEAANV